LGPEARNALKEGSGLLLGAQRPGWVDVLGYEPLFREGWKEIVRRRFDDPPERDVVGVALPEKDFERSRDALIRELVPGDVLLVLGEKDTTPQIYIHLGDRWASARLEISRGGPSISTRSSRL
jgi:hypothetical protein